MLQVYEILASKCDVCVEFSLNFIKTILWMLYANPFPLFKVIYICKIIRNTTRGDAPTEISIVPFDLKKSNDFFRLLLKCQEKLA